MKPVEFVSIGGYVFRLEDDARAVVGNYLDELTKFYSDKESGSEVMEGIEERMCELLLEQCGQGGVVSLPMVEKVIATLGKPEAIEEEWVEWYADTGEIGYEYADKKYVSKATVRAYVPTRSEVEVLVSYDDRPFESVGTIRAYDDVKSTSLSFSPYRCDHFKIRFTGHGDCMIYTLSLTTEYGSEE